ncbi:uncharacterized protein LOC124149062 [Haliotis rufescens]|uniref:uncharacterized protein LOC124149062 n=1 Tax=Haliotis rufescens TaxID=6454 RepID=UPI00201F7F45|nr:uncharacterized protein LOC124149062 [Haliotis rufescens]
MLALRLTVFALLFCGTCGFSRYWFNLFNNCNPPEQLVGKFCAAVVDNDANDDGRVDFRDVHKQILYFNYDDDPCSLQQWEVVTRWTCRYGYSEDYARFMYSIWDPNKDGVVNADDFTGFNLSNVDFLSVQYIRFKDMYCSDPKNRENPVDRVQCAEVDALKPEDINCT